MGKVQIAALRWHVHIALAAVDFHLEHQLIDSDETHTVGWTSPVA